MNEKFLAQLVLELQNAQSEALSLLTQAICQQIDPKRLNADLKRITQAYQMLPSSSQLALKLIQGAQAAAHAEQMLQGKPPSEGPHPKRED